MTAPPPESRAPDDPTLPLPARRSGNALPDGTRLAEFETVSVIGEGGFGIVYLARDHTLRRQVAVKEYMPWSLASRGEGGRVTPRSEKAAETFALGMRSFINEAQLLASFDHPSLVKVHRFWEDNGTAYMAMPFYQGITLKRALARLEAPPEEGWLLQQLGQLLDALEVMHGVHCFHRDIAPDNILLLDDGVPLLLDFGAARRVIGDATQALTAFLKPGYAPVEQYAEMPQMKQGAWTDLYALGAVVHYAITGHTPPESVARLVTETMQPLAQVAAGRYSERFLRAIDHALAVQPAQRPQSVAAMREALGLESPRTRHRKRGEIPTAPAPLDSRPITLQSMLPPAGARGSDGTDTDATRPPSAVPPAEPAAARGSMRAVPWAAGALGLIALGAAAWWWFGAAAPLADATVRSPTPPAAEPSTTPTTAPTAGPVGARGDGGDASRVSGAVGATEPAAPKLPAADDLLPGVADAPSVSIAPASAAGAGPVSVTGPTTLPATAPASNAVTPAPAAEATTPAPAQPPLAREPDATAGGIPEAPPPRHAARNAEPAAKPTPKLTAPDPRCAEIIARVSLGEALTAAERALMQKECRR